MGILDSVGGLMGGGAGSSGLAEQVMALVTSQENGGLAGLAERFTGAGLGDVVASWIGTGQNLPISAEQITKALGHAQVSAVASKAGMPVEQVASSLAQLLPQLVDGLTPDGAIPSGGNLLAQATALLGRLSSRG